MKLAIHYSYNEVVQTVECDAFDVANGVVNLRRNDPSNKVICHCSAGEYCFCTPVRSLIGMVRDFQFIEVMP